MVGRTPDDTSNFFLSLVFYTHQLDANTRTDLILTVDGFSPSNRKRGREREREREQVIILTRGLARLN